MKTEKGESAKTRSAVVRLSNAISLETFSSDLDFQTNMGLAKRTGEDNSIAQSEQHKSFYVYTLTIDLDRVGIDGDIVIPQKEKADRVKLLLNTVQFLYRDIRGRRENLSPIFVIGGVYNRKNPYFDNRIRLNKRNLNISILNEIFNSDEDIKENTIVGYLDGIFPNSSDIIEQLPAVSISKAFQELSKRVEAVYK